jgi:hypothetical protein
MGVDHVPIVRAPRTRAALAGVAQHELAADGLGGFPSAFRHNSSSK